MSDDQFSPGGHVHLVAGDEQSTKLAGLLILTQNKLIGLAIEEITRLRAAAGEDEPLPGVIKAGIVVMNAVEAKMNERADEVMEEIKRETGVDVSSQVREMKASHAPRPQAGVKTTAEDWGKVDA